MNPTCEYCNQVHDPSERCKVYALKAHIIVLKNKLARFEKEATGKLILYRERR